MGVRRATRGLGGAALVAVLGGVAWAVVPSRPDDPPTPAAPTLDPSDPAPVDARLEALWAESKAKPSPPATDAEFLRRASLDLLGRIPTVAEAQAFLASREPGKRAKLVARMLEHPDYARNLATVYANVLIGRRDRGGDVDRGALTTWLRRQFAANRPWDELARELLAAKGSNKENGAVNYVLAHFADQKVNLTASATRVFLGQQIQCTQCHDHKSNDWKQQDFWGINAFFRGVQSRPIEREAATGELVRDGVEVYDDPTDEWARFERPNATVGVVPPTFLDGRRIDPGLDPDRRAELAKMIADPANEQFARAFVNRMWGTLLGRGIVHPVDDFGDHNPPADEELIALLARDFRASGFDVKALVRRIVLSRAYQVSSLPAGRGSESGEEAPFGRFMIRPMTPEQLFDSLITATAAQQAAGSDRDEVRNRWLGQFLVAFDNDEAGESTSFQGTIPQALLMMNGELMRKAVGGEPGSFLALVVDQARLQRKVPPARYAVDQVYLAAYARYPTPAERARAEAVLQSDPDTLALLQDLFWALLNSNEFVLNH